MISFVRLCLLVVFVCFSLENIAQSKVSSRKISPELFGLFFEDINYSADGGLYAELIQNRSFEYNPAEQKNWNPYSGWEYTTPGFSYGAISIETSSPLNSSNPHYAVLTIEHVGHEKEYEGISGVGIRNNGFDGIVIRKGEKYNLSLFARQLSPEPVSLSLFLQNSKGEVLSKGMLRITSSDWKKYNLSLVSDAASDSASLVVLGTSEGKIAVDVISLFPEKTFRNRSNGLRNDMAQVLAEMKPRFIRFPGGCLVHGDGLNNMYQWKNSIGPVEQRLEQKNLWGYHQTLGLGYFEYFQFCEDIGAKPLPVLPAAVSCQNSGGTWRNGGTGQQALPMDQMPDYIQDVLDLIEWANGPVNSKWGSKRAEAGHPASFNLQYIGIGNEDKITPEFETRFKLIYDAVKAKYPEITVIGTVGPFPHGEDFDKGWDYASRLKIPVVDEHYYKEPEWLLKNLARYDSYDRSKSKVYLGEYASWGNKLKNAIAEASYMISLERNGDVVQMASYAPLFAKKDHTQWKTDMIFFDNEKICLTPNYYVQKLFSLNQGDVYLNGVIPSSDNLSASCVKDTRSGSVILKIVNTGGQLKPVNIDLSKIETPGKEAVQFILTGDPEAENTFLNPEKVKPVEIKRSVSRSFKYEAPAMSLTIIRIENKK